MTLKLKKWGNSKFFKLLIYIVRYVNINRIQAYNCYVQCQIWHIGCILCLCTSYMDITEWRNIKNEVFWHRWFPW